MPSRLKSHMFLVLDRLQCVAWVNCLVLSKTVKEKDLGVTMNANMKVSEQCRIAASKGNHVLGMIRRNIAHKEKSMIIPLYKTIVRPHLEYCIQAWNPYLRKDVDMLEKNPEESN